MTLEEAKKQIRPVDQEAVCAAQKRWDSIAKPLHSLGKMEKIVMQIAGITGSADVRLDKRALVAMCADNGVVEEGVTQTGQEVTAIVAENFLKGDTSACVMCRQCGTDVFPVDVGMASDTKVPSDLKVMMGTRNMTKEPAMAYEEAVQGIEAGIEMVRRLKEQGYRLIATGEMGIGNTTTSSAVASVLLNRSVEEMTGRGAGLSGEGLKRKIDAIKRAVKLNEPKRKIDAIKRAVKLNEPDPSDPVDVLAKVGGLDIAGMAGVFIGGAVYRIPVVIDGFISCVAALVAQRISPLTKDYMIASHVSREPAAAMILEALEKEAVLHGEMCLGEGSGAVALFPFIDMGLAVYESMSTFEEIKVEQYEELV